MRDFYRPELDALRFFAFFAVLLHHGPAAPGVAGIVRDMGGFGLSMFFLLSAYLITELLLRERKQTGTIAWKLFYIRRALRIWPLYLAAVATGSAIGADRRALTGMLLFVANWIPVDAGRLLAPLWSISIEEQFYLIWPAVIRRGGLGVSVILVIASGVWIGSFAGRGWRLWYDTPVQFLFFATGALIAFASPPLERRAGDRAFLMILGLMLLVVASKLGVGIAEATGLSRAGLLIGYGCAAAGCGAIFISVLGLQGIPRVLIYGGRTSYGLYVFHSGMLEVAGRLPVPHFTLVRMAAVDGLALLLSVIAAHYSYRYFEKPFLRLKERFAVVKSRPA